jgi:hypothetical protein
MALRRQLPREIEKIRKAEECQMESPIGPTNNTY